MLFALLDYFLAYAVPSRLGAVCFCPSDSYICLHSLFPYLPLAVDYPFSFLPQFPHCFHVSFCACFQAKSSRIYTSHLLMISSRAAIPNFFLPLSHYFKELGVRMDRHREELKDGFFSYCSFASSVYILFRLYSYRGAFFLRDWHWCGALGRMRHTSLTSCEMRGLFFSSSNSASMCLHLLFYPLVILITPLFIWFFIIAAWTPKSSRTRTHRARDGVPELSI